MCALNEVKGMVVCMKERNVGVSILLSIITCGIYAIYWFIVLTDEAKEASDIVIMDDDLTKIQDAIDISKYTKHIIVQNIIIALSVKIIALIIGILGILESFGMVIAIFADSGICIITILTINLYNRLSSSLLIF